MEEVLRDVEYDDKVDDWRTFFGYRSKKDYHEVSLLDHAAQWETEISVSTYNGFPDTPFRIQVGNEVMEVTRVHGHVMEVLRGAEATTPASHDVGDKISVCSP